MEIDILTLFPGMFTPLNESIVGRAINSGVVDIRLWNIRDFATDRHKTVDDAPYGGGPGMVMKVEPIARALEYVDEQTGSKADRVILMTPQGRTFDQSTAEEFSKLNRIVFVCGHYEGVDERVRELLVTDELSIGDYVLTGGELPAMVVVDAVVRLIPGVLGNEAGPIDDSFSSGLLEYPQYTRPQSFRGHEPPDILLSGHHGEIHRWRRRQSLARTWKRRPDLLAQAERAGKLTKDDLQYIEELKKQQG